MDKLAILNELQNLMRIFFEDPTIEVNRRTTVEDIDAWDSLNHMNFIAAVEEKFRIKIPFRAVARFENIGDLMDFIVENQV